MIFNWVLNVVPYIFPLAGPIGTLLIGWKPSSRYWGLGLQAFTSVCWIVYATIHLIYPLIWAQAIYLIVEIIAVCRTYREHHK